MEYKVRHRLCCRSDGQRILPAGIKVSRLYGFLICAAITAATNVSAGETEAVRFEVVVDRNVQTASNLQWYDAHHLLGQFDDHRGLQAAVLTLSMSGTRSDLIWKGNFPSVSPDGRLLIAFTQNRWVVRDTSNTYVGEIDGPGASGERCKPRHRPRWSRNGRYAAFIECYGRVAPEKPSEIEPKTDVRVVDLAKRRPALQPGSRIAIFDRQRPEEIRKIRLDEFALELAWGPGATLYVTTSELISGEASTKLMRVRPGSANATEIYRTAGRFQNMRPAVHPDGQVIALVLDADHRSWDDFQSLILIDATTGRELRRMTHDLPLVGSDYCWSRAGDELYARVRHGGLDQIFAIPLEGNPRRLTHGERRHYAMQLSPDGHRLAYQTEDGYGRKDIRVLNLEEGEEKTLLVLDEPAKEFNLGLWRQIRWTSTDGVSPFGFLFLPPGFDPATRYPMLVDVHGGGQGSRLYLDAPFSISIAPGPLEWHAWAARGFVVFVPDYRSTGGYGHEVIGSIYQSGVLASTQDIDDIVSGTRFVLEQGFVDPSKIAILGHSAGGQRVIQLLTKYTFYSAAVVNEAIPPDPVSLVIGKLSGDNTGRYPNGIFRQLFGGELDDYPDRYKANYIFDSYRITTPTLIMVGNEALGGVSHMPLEVIFSVLRNYSVPAKMLKFIDEGHTYSEPDTAKYAFREARRWIEAHTDTR